MGGLRVLEVNPLQEAQAIGLLLSSLFGEDMGGSRFDWLYLKNPDGTPRVWMLKDDAGFVGVAAAVPRFIQASGRRILACVLADFCVSPKYRSIGPALQLQRACLQVVEEGWAQFAFDFPSSAMMAVYGRLGVKNGIPLVRWAKPLRADPIVQERMGLGLASTMVSNIVNAALLLREQARRPSKSNSIAEYCGRFTEEFADLANGFLSGNDSWGVDRNADYLNWRYLQHPTKRYRVWTARRRERLEAFAIVTGDTQGVIADLFTSGNDESLNALLYGLAESYRTFGHASLSLPLAAKNRLESHLFRRGFRQREECPVVIYGNPPVSGLPWFAEGDRES